MKKGIENYVNEFKTKKDILIKVSLTKKNEAVYQACIEQFTCRNDNEIWIKQGSAIITYNPNHLWAELLVTEINTFENDNISHKGFTIDYIEREFLDITKQMANDNVGKNMITKSEKIIEEKIKPDKLLIDYISWKIYCGRITTNQVREYYFNLKELS